METIDPLEFHDDIQVALPEVVCTLETESSSTSPPSPVLPCMLAPSPPKTDETGGSPTTRRRKYSAVASFFPGCKSAESSTREEDTETTTTPILAVLESVSRSPDKGSEGRTRDLDAFHFSVVQSSTPLPPSQPSPSSPEPPETSKTRGRARSTAARFVPISDLRTSNVPSEPLDPASRTDNSSSPLYHHQSTKTRILSTLFKSKTLDSTSPENGCSSCEDKAVGARKRLQDVLVVSTPTNIEVGGSNESRGMEMTSSPGEPIRTVVPARLPPIATHSHDPESLPRRPSPRKVRSTLVEVTMTTCAVCGLALDRGDVAETLVLDAAQTTVHRACFRCVQCHIPLTLANFHTLSSNPEEVRIRPSAQRMLCAVHSRTVT